MKLRITKKARTVNEIGSQRYIFRVLDISIAKSSICFEVLAISDIVEVNFVAEGNVLHKEESNS